MNSKAGTSTPKPGRLTLKKLEGMETVELEGLLRRLASETTPDKQAEAVKKILRARYRKLAEHGGQTVPLASARKAGLREIPSGLLSDSQSLGDLNPLMSGMPFAIAPFSQVVTTIAHRLIEATGGIRPEIGVHMVATQENPVPRMVVQWNVRRTISADELHALSRLVPKAYEKEVAAYRQGGNGWRSTGTYRDFGDQIPSPNQRGIYLGPESYYNATAVGLFAHRRFKTNLQARYLLSEHPLDWMSQEASPETVTHLELRDTGLTKDGLSHDNFLMLVVQISYLLAHGAIIEAAPLMARIFQELNEVGTKQLEREMLYGMSEALEAIERVLLFPVQHPERARRLHIEPESVLLVGVPGVGKTSLAHYLMTAGYNAIFAAVDGDMLQADLMKADKPGDVSGVLARVDRISRLSSLPVVLLIDDIETILSQRVIVSKFLNMLKGIRQKGLLIVASTNYPEKLDGRLLEPGRLSTVVHLRLPNLHDRRGVLANYLGRLPFSSPEVRDKTVETEARATAGWTQRLLWELTVQAALSSAEEAIATHREDECLEPHHFVAARERLTRTAHLKKIEAWEKRISRFVAHSRSRIGFVNQPPS